MPVSGPRVALSGPGFLFKRDAVFFQDHFKYRTGSSLCTMVLSTR